jgi:hypothetical protein
MGAVTMSLAEEVTGILTCWGSQMTVSGVRSLSPVARSVWPFDLSWQRKPHPTSVGVNRFDGR